MTVCYFLWEGYEFHVWTNFDEKLTICFRFSYINLHFKEDIEGAFEEIIMSSRDKGTDMDIDIKCDVSSEREDNFCDQSPMTHNLWILSWTST